MRLSALFLTAALLAPNALFAQQNRATTIVPISGGMRVLPNPNIPRELPTIVLPAVCHSQCYNNVSQVWFAPHDGAGVIQACASASSRGAPDMNVPCGSYGCNKDNGRCRETCNDNSQCAPGNACVWGVCQFVTYSCDINNPSQLLGSDGRSYDCGQYRCQGSACLKTCANSNDCSLNGYVCDMTHQQCVRP